MRSRPMISIITPSYFSENHIEDCILSVLKQTYDNWEMFIVDGESRDSTVQIVEKYARYDSRIKLINNPNDNGPAHARAHGLKIANGDYLAFIDSDDLWLPEKLELQLNFMVENRYSFTFTRYKKLFKDRTVSKASMGGYASNTYSQYLRRRGICNSTVMLKKDCVNNDLLATVGKSHGEDMLWWLLIMKNGHTAFALQKTLSVYRLVDGSLSSNVMDHQLSVWHSYRNELGLSLMSAGYNYILYILDVAFRRFKFRISNLDIIRKS